MTHHDRRHRNRSRLLTILGAVNKPMEVALDDP
jgi:hypothetical protein